MSRLAVLFACLLLAGCGSAGGEEEGGSASLWITRDRGETVLYEGQAQPGQTAMQALRRAADVETAYGGRFVQAISGIEGSLERGFDWFYFVNGISADRGAAEYRIRPGDVIWWDYRRWSGDAEVQAVVGAFPEPFLHGYEGKVRPAAVRYELPAQREAAEELADLIGAESVARAGTPPPAGASVLELVAGPPRFEASAEGPRGPYRFVLAGDAMRLAREPEIVRFRYEGLP